MQTHENDLPRLVTVNELAALLGKAPRTIRWWRQRGFGPRAIVLGSTTFFIAADVRAWLENGGKRPAGRPRKVTR